ncbi:MAG: hypothetical protein PHD58_06020 [Anaerolineales bacterium]|nr:hypothetical protein [Anaerolineales bacterium]
MTTVTQVPAGNQHSVSRRLLAAAFWALTILPIGNIVWLVASTGTNTLSNDYLLFAPLVDRILSGGYDWRHYFADTLLMNGSQSLAVPFLLRLAAIRLAHWNVYVEIGFGLLLALAKLGLAYTVLARQASAPARRWLLPALAALFFSTAQINAFTNGETALEIGAIQIGMVLGIWALGRSEAHWWETSVMSLGGVIASLSGGGGLAVWPAFLLGLLMRKDRHWAGYLAWCAGLLLSIAPYAAHGFLRHTPGTGFFALDPELWVTALGYPFANQIGGGFSHHTEGFWIGIGGLLFCLAGLLLIWRRGAALRQRAIPAILFIAIGALNAAQISLTRQTLAPWYTSYTALFWVGLVGLAAVAWPGETQPQEATSAKNQLLAPNEVWSVALLVTLVALYLRSNLTYRDKVFYLPSRSPASASCLRHYWEAPTYCEGMVFQWGVGHPTYLAELGSVLGKHRLSVFAPKQTWWLQGDFVLEAVTVSEAADVPDVFWVEGWSDRVTFWQDYHHLNLLLPTPNRVSWTVSLPQELQQAVFRSAVAMDRYAPASLEADGLVFEIYVKPEGEARHLAYSQRILPGRHGWQAIELPLNEYRGKTITLLMKSKGRSNFAGDLPVLRSPRIDLELGQTLLAQIAPTAPANTELSVRTAALASGERLVLAQGPGDWVTSGVQVAQEAGERWMIIESPRFEPRQPVDLCVGGYSHFYVWLAASKEVSPRAVKISWEMYRLDEPFAYRNEAAIWIPLLADEGMHLYTYELKLLQPSQNTRLTRLELAPLIEGWVSGVSWIEVGEAGFIANPEPGSCNPIVP